MTTFLVVAAGFLYATALLAVANHHSNSHRSRSVEHHTLPLPMIRSHRRTK